MKLAFAAAGNAADKGCVDLLGVETGRLLQGGARLTLIAGGIYAILASLNMQCAFQATAMHCRWASECLQLAFLLHWTRASQLALSVASAEKCRVSPIAPSETWCRQTQQSTQASAVGSCARLLTPMSTGSFEVVPLDHTPVQECA